MAFNLYLDCDPNALRYNLKQLGYNPGPITHTTYRVYLKKLEELQKTSSKNIQNQVLSNSLPFRNESTFNLYLDCDPNTLRYSLKQLGYNPGPITHTTYRVYLKKLEELRKMPPRSTQKQSESNSLLLKTNKETFNLNTYNNPDTSQSNFKQLDLKDELQKKLSRATECRAQNNSLLSITNLTTVDFNTDYDPDTLRYNLKQLGYIPGPITPTTYRVYLKKLEELRKLSTNHTQNQHQKNSLLLDIDRGTLNKLDEIPKIPSKVNKNQPQHNSLKLDKKREVVTSNSHCDSNTLQDNLEQLVLREKLQNVTSKTTQNQLQSDRKAYSAELQKSIQEPEWMKNCDYIQLEKKLIDEYINIPARELRGGSTKSFYTYLLLDPRITLNLPFRASTMDQTDRWKTFITSIFYVGKGKGDRMYAHLFEASKAWNTQESNKKLSGKIQQIKDIWKAQKGVICLRIFENILSEEAYTREAVMIQAIGVNNLQNLQAGEYHGSVKKWDIKDKCLLGVYLLYKAMQKFLNEGEHQLRHADVKIKKLLAENLFK
ncbi:uncharacterized protein LOC123294090 [Chrysoperla carnea]|uniref:uncharacterized protein LOC123294090 n=1 Tax=Chrysoperla carnea TaxID=189513 RepID=UPI001D064A61|nr:uncharacterized protein LOC123294090 [Chrysoperla carnea]